MVFQLSGQLCEGLQNGARCGQIHLEGEMLRKTYYFTTIPSCESVNSHERKTVLTFDSLDSSVGSQVT